MRTEGDCLAEEYLNSRLAKTVYPTKNEASEFADFFAALKHEDDLRPLHTDAHNASGGPSSLDLSRTPLSFIADSTMKKL